jgi:glutaredoxin-related protein
MKVRFFGSHSCRDCLKVFVLLNRSQVDYEYVDAYDEDVDVQLFCDINNVEELPHLQFLNDKEEVVIEHIGPIGEEDFLSYLSDYFPNY